MSETAPPSPPEQRHNRLASARRALQTETAGMTSLLAALDHSLGEALADAVAVIARSTGRVIVSGMGKSGHVGRKIASTLASTGTPAQFVHPAEASHGDLGMITRHDVVLVLSNSGESSELVDILNYTRRFAVPLIAMTARHDSALGRAADIVLLLPKAQEACPNGLAPTTSTLLQLALGDALAVTLLEDKSFSALDFKQFHPGGKLGSQLKYVKDLMRKGDALPLAAKTVKMTEALVVMTEKSCGCLGLIEADGRLAGIITDGDLRRKMSPSLLSENASAVMTVAPKTVSADRLASEVLEILNSANITSIFVVDEQQQPIGLLHIHDLLRVGIV